MLHNGTISILQPNPAHGHRAGLLGPAHPGGQRFGCGNDGNDPHRVGRERGILTNRTSNHRELDRWTIRVASNEVRSSHPFAKRTIRRATPHMKPDRRHTALTNAPTKMPGVCGTVCTSTPRTWTTISNDSERKVGNRLGRTYGSPDGPSPIFLKTNENSTIGQTTSENLQYPMAPNPTDRPGNHGLAGSVKSLAMLVVTSVGWWTQVVDNRCPSSITYAKYMCL